MEQSPTLEEFMQKIVTENPRRIRNAAICTTSAGIFTAAALAAGQLGWVTPNDAQEAAAYAAVMFYGKAVLVCSGIYAGLAVVQRKVAQQYLARRGARADNLPE